MNLRLIIFTLSSLIFASASHLNAAQNSLAGQDDWNSDDMQQIWSAWKNSCTGLRKKQLIKWINLCNIADRISPTDPQIKSFFEENFILEPIKNNDGTTEGIITGYYEPVLAGSLTKDSDYKYPVYRKPANTDLRSLTRKQIDSQPEKFKNDILLWTNDPYDLFFLHVQGSGRVQLKDGSQKSLVYAGNNGHNYTSIGKVLINNGQMLKENVSLETLKNWLVTHPGQATGVLQQNKRYIFFDLVDTPKNESSPRGSLNVPLTPQRSIAIDPEHVTLGSPVWLETTLPNANGEPQIFRRLMFAQDTGAAIKGHVRADVFFGRGIQAEYLAGNMNQSGKMYLLVPR